MGKRIRREATLTRKQGRKKGSPRILIVCEGTKTETNYFTAIRRERRLSGARVQIMPSDYGTDPLSVVNYARDRFLAEGRVFDAVYAVFDRDEHHSYHNALARAAALSGALRNDVGVTVDFQAIPSVPNFELWLLLHFRDVLAPIHREEVFAELKKPTFYPSYAKNSGTAYEDTKARLSDANPRAAHLRAVSDRTNGTDPLTDVDVIVDKLLKIPVPWA